jgi:hypothetical protein
MNLQIKFKMFNRLTKLILDQNRKVMRINKCKIKSIKMTNRKKSLKINRKKSLKVNKKRSLKTNSKKKRLKCHPVLLTIRKKSLKLLIPRLNSQRNPVIQRKKNKSSQQLKKELYSHNNKRKSHSMQELVQHHFCHLSCLARFSMLEHCLLKRPSQAILPVLKKMKLRWIDKTLKNFFR